MGPDPEDDSTSERLRWRGVKDPCLTCHGSGVRLYSSTSTWRGGMGGSMMTRDVCDTCWGSGDRFHTGCDLRRLRDEEYKRVAEGAVDALARSVGASLHGPGGTRPAIMEIVYALEAIANKRGAPKAPWLPELAGALAKLLKKATGAP